MAKVTTKKEITLHLLDQELGAVGLRAEGDLWGKDEVTIWNVDGDITDEQLRAAIKAHVAQPAPPGVLI